MTNLSGAGTFTNSNATAVPLTINTTGTQTFSGTITGGGNIVSHLPGQRHRDPQRRQQLHRQHQHPQRHGHPRRRPSQGANGPLGNSNNPVFIGDSVGSNSAALLTNVTGTVSRDIATLGNTTNAGTITLGAAANLSGTYTGNLTLSRDLTLQSPSANFETFNFANSGQGITGPWNVTVLSNGNGSTAQAFLGTNNTFTGNLTSCPAICPPAQFSVGNATAIFVGDTSGSNNASLETNFNGLAYTQNITVRSGSSGTAFIGTNNAANPTYNGNIILNKDLTFTAGTGGDGATFNGNISTGPGPSMASPTLPSRRRPPPAPSR